MFEIYESQTWLFTIIAGLIFIAFEAVIIISFTYQMRKHGKTTYDFKLRWVVAPAIIFSIALAVICYNGEKDASEYYSSKINELYNAEVVNIDSIDVAVKEVYSGKPSGKIVVRFGDDNRVYETYLIKDKDSDNLSLYTRNEKGVYLPVTQASSKYASNGSYVDNTESKSESNQENPSEDTEIEQEENNNENS